MGAVGICQVPLAAKSWRVEVKGCFLRTRQESNTPEISETNAVHAVGYDAASDRFDLRAVQFDTVFDVRPTSLHKCEVIPRRARI